MYFFFFFPQILTFFGKKKKKKKIQTQKIACSFPCLGCENESTKCLGCVESFLKNDTNCISNEECLFGGGYPENGTCYGFSFLFSILILKLLLN